jgi:catechol 2,3-dioxygenase-like lactoylglutathione lyase family enzyme
VADKMFELDGLSHLALNCADMARTVEFYEGVLGIPLVKTMEVPGGQGGQHFFFDVGRGECLAFFYFPDMPARDVPIDIIGGPQNAGLMNHAAFRVPADKFFDYRSKLDEFGLRSVYVRHDTDGGFSMDPAETLNDKTFALTVYFPDPDGNIIEFCSWLPAYEQLGRDHEPAGQSAKTTA